MDIDSEFWDLFKPKQVTCASCGYAYERPGYIDDIVIYGSPDLDTRPAENARSFYLYWGVERCTSCGFCGNVDEADDEDIVFIRSKPYLDQLNNPAFSEMANSYLCSSMIEENKGDFARAGWSSVYAAWCCDGRGYKERATETAESLDDEDKGDLWIEDLPSSSASLSHDDKNYEERARECRIRACELLKLARENNQPISDIVGKAEALMADLYRRAGQFQLALQACREGLEQMPDRLIADVLRFQIKLANRADTSRHTLDEATSATRYSLGYSGIALEESYRPEFSRKPDIPPKDECEMCGRCIDICPNHCINWWKYGLPYLANTKDCDGCLLCTLECPKQRDEWSEWLKVEQTPSLHKAYSLYREGQLNDAIREFEQLLLLAPRDFFGRKLLGFALLASGSPEEAAESFRKALSIYPGDCMLRCRLGLLYESKGSFNEAVQEYLAAIETDPEYFEPHLRLGSLLHRAGHNELAANEMRAAMLIECFGEPFRRYPWEFEVPLHWLVKFGISPPEGYGNIPWKFKVPPQWLDKFGISPPEGYDTDELSLLTERLGLLVRLSPNDLANYLRLGRALLKKGLIDDAVKAFREALRLEPQYVYTHSYLADALEAKGMISEAMQEYDATLEVFPDHTVSLYGLWRCIASESN